MKNRIAFITLLLMMASCSMSNSPVEARAKKAKRARKKDVVVGVAVPWASENYMLWEGVEMAVDEINAGKGILGRKLAIVKKDDGGSVSRGQSIAQEFAESLDMVAVIGHVDSYISIPTSIIYEYYGLLMISPCSTNPRLTSQGFKRVFRAIPSDDIIGRALARFCKEQKFRNVMIYHINNEYGSGLANVFEKECEAGGVSVVDRASYDSFSGKRNFLRDIKYWKENFEFDAVFLAARIPQAAVFIQTLRETGIDVPVVGGDGLDTSELVTIAGEAADNTYVGSTFHRDDPSPRAQAFMNAFRKRYGKDPDAAAAQGYDTVMVLAHAMETAGCTIPDKVAETLRTMPPWQGVTGSFSFDRKGDLVDRDVLIKKVEKGRLEFFKK